MTWLTPLDSFLRHQDFYWNRTAGGLLDRSFGVARHTPAAVALSAIVCSLLVLGPSASAGLRLWLSAPFALILIVVGVTTMCATQRRGIDIVWDLRLQVIIACISAGAVWWVAGSTAVERSGVLYRHIGLLILPTFAVSLLIASFVAPRLFKRSSAFGGFHQALAQTELFVVRDPPEKVTFDIIVRSVITAAFRSPLRLILPAALVVLVAWPGEVVVPLCDCSLSWASALGGVALVMTAVLLTAAGVRRRLSVMLTLAEGPFFRGAARLVSLFVIAVALARLADFSYVSTLLDSAPGQTILLWCASLYVLSWWYDYWATRLVTEQLLGTLGTPIDGKPVIEYPFVQPKVPTTRVPATGRCLQIHGSGRFIVICPNSDRAARFPFFFHAYAAPELFALLAGSPLVPAGADAMRLFEQRTRTYLMWIAGVPIAVFAAATLWLHNGPQAPEIVASEAKSRVAPSAALFGNDACAQGEPVVVLAASGGGTRAALYTASVLDGLAHIGRLDAVRMVSGISGGGAALAYFASHRSELLNSRSNDWDTYFDLMAQPYIKDVVNGAGEWRIARRARLGHLLAESFRDRWELKSRSRLGEIDAPGLILNSSLTGHFDRTQVCQDPRTTGCSGSIEDVEAKHRSANSTELTAGRLIYTNMTLTDNFGTKGLGSNGSIRLPIVVVNRQNVALTAAAAANANFPPVFPNAAVDVDDQRRYWVTDGGAIDNRAMETLLYAVGGAIDEQPWIECPRPPEIHMIVADASAFSNTFRQDRAVGTAIAAGSTFASQLVAEVFRDVAARYQSHNGKLFFHYLPMPNLLRRSGAFGTHWMLQPRIRVLHDGVGWNMAGESIARVIRAMHGDQHVALTDDEQKVLAWSITDTDKHGDLWSEIVDALR